MFPAWSEIKLEVSHVFISQKLKKLKKEESLPFGPSCAANFLEQWYLLLHPPWLYQQSKNTVIFRTLSDTRSSKLYEKDFSEDINLCTLDSGISIAP